VNGDITPFKEAKLIINHNATDETMVFQAALMVKVGNVSIML